jgi:hypothetical protein
MIFGFIYHLLHGGDVFNESFLLTLAVIFQSQVRIFSQFLVGNGQFEIVARAQIMGVSKNWNTPTTAIFSKTYVEINVVLFDLIFSSLPTLRRSNC